MIESAYIINIGISSKKYSVCEKTDLKRRKPPGPGRGGQTGKLPVNRSNIEKNLLNNSIIPQRRRDGKNGIKMKGKKVKAVER